MLPAGDVLPIQGKSIKIVSTVTYDGRKKLYRMMGKVYCPVQRLIEMNNNFHMTKMKYLTRV